MADQHKTWLVTGSSRGLGRAIVEGILQRGDRVAATARRTSERADLAGASGDRVLAARLDVTDPPDARQVVATAALFAVILLFPAIARSDGVLVEPYSGKPTAGETRLMRQWRDFLLKRGEADAGRYSADVPFSFRCGERSSREWVKVADAQITSADWKGGIRKHVLTWADPQTRLVCQMTMSEFSDFPALEWVVRLRNDGSGDSANVHDFKALDIAWNSPRGIMPLLHRSVGGPSIEQDFQFQTEVMHSSLWRKNRRIRMDSKSNADWMNALGDACIPTDQRPSSVWLPMFNYQTADDGLIAALGWNGTWFAEFDHTGQGKSSLAAGMENLNARLRPGESIRSPLSMVMYWQGELMHAQNIRSTFCRGRKNIVTAKPSC